MNSVLVSCQWLEEHLNDENIIVLDVSMAKVVGKEPLVYDTFQAIPTSLKCSLERDFSDIHSDGVNVFPTQRQFAEGVNKLGIDQNSTVILYDDQGVYSSPRAWWIFKTMGFERAYILDGGLPQWIKEKRETSNTHKTRSLSSAEPFETNYCSNNVCSSDYVLETIPDNRKTVLDARSPARFTGVEKEPREGVKSGHIPRSINVPFGLVLDDFKFKSEPELSSMFKEKLPSTTEQIVFSCGSGITACIVLAAAYVAGYTNLSLYDGSWSEWGSSGHPVATLQSV